VYWCFFLPFNLKVIYVKWFFFNFIIYIEEKKRDNPSTTETGFSVFPQITLEPVSLQKVENI